MCDAWHCYSYQRGDYFLSRRGQTDVAGQLGRTSMQWLAIANRAVLAPWLLHFVLSSGSDHSIRAWYGEFSKERMLRESFDAAVATDTVRTILDPLYSWHAGNSAEPSSSQTSITRLPVDSGVNSGRWFKTIFLTVALKGHPGTRTRRT